MRKRERLVKAFEKMETAVSLEAGIERGMWVIPFSQFVVEHDLPLKREEIHAVEAGIREMAENAYDELRKKLDDFFQGEVYDHIDLEEKQSCDTDYWNKDVLEFLEHKKRFLLDELKFVRAQIKEYQEKQQGVAAAD